MINIKDNINKIKARILQACQQSGRLTPDTIATESSLPVTLLAVSKTKPAALIEQAYLAGQRDFGENYLQEAVNKISQLTHLPAISWHFIGPIQSNKSRLVAEHFNWVHTLDRLKLALRLNEQRPEDFPNMNVLIQVNISQQQSKSGVAVNEIFELAQQIQELDNLTLRGLMCIPAPNEDGKLKADFLAMQQQFLLLQKKYPQVDTLSMGMSADLALAIECGSTMVRVGSAIFGQRI